MGIASPRFVKALESSHTVISYVDVVSPSQRTVRLTVIDGSVTVDRTAQFRRAATVKAIDPSAGGLAPSGNSGIMTPFGTEVRPYRGIVYDDGTVEAYPLGVFRMSKVTITESSSGSANIGTTYDLEMFDRSRVISRNKFLTPYTVAVGTSLVTAIKLIIARTFPDAKYDAISNSMVTQGPKLYDTGSDPWAAVTDLATSMGCEIYFDVDGDVVIAPPADIDALPSPDFTYVEGNGNTMTDLQSIYTDSPGFNGVIVTGQSTGNTSPPVRAESWDMQASSPTYRFGPYGEVPQFVNDTNVVAVADAQAEADSLLKGMIGLSSQLVVTAWTNPALEAGNVVQVTRGPLNINGLYAVDAFTVPLKKDGAQAITLRQKRLAA